jgi:hypothetical protein
MMFHIVSSLVGILWLEQNIHKRHTPQVIALSRKILGTDTETMAKALLCLSFESSAQEQEIKRVALARESTYGDFSISTMAGALGFEPRIF